MVGWESDVGLEFEGLISQRLVRASREDWTYDPWLVFIQKSAGSTVTLSGVEKPFSPWFSHAKRATKALVGWRANKASMFLLVEMSTAMVTV